MSGRSRDAALDCISDFVACSGCNGPCRCPVDQYGYPIAGRKQLKFVGRLGDRVLAQFYPMPVYALGGRLAGIHLRTDLVAQGFGRRRKPPPGMAVRCTRLIGRVSVVELRHRLAAVAGPHGSDQLQPGWRAVFFVPSPASLWVAARVRSRAVPVTPGSRSIRSSVRSVALAGLRIFRRNNSRNQRMGRIAPEMENAGGDKSLHGMMPNGGFHESAGVGDRGVPCPAPRCAGGRAPAVTAMFSAVPRHVHLQSARANPLAGGAGAARGDDAPQRMNTVRVPPYGVRGGMVLRRCC